MANCSCSSDNNGKGCFDRRDFLKTVGAGAVSLGALEQALGAATGQLGENEHIRIIPENKNLDGDWVRSLFARGQKQVYSDRQELKHIGMPIGGICCGQLYLGGDGKLWLWDIFKSHYQSDYGGMSMGKNYVNPPLPNSPLEQGFAVRIKSRGKTVVRTLDSDGFADIAFRGEYPVGRVSYRDSKLPVSVDLEAFSPFVPLDAEDSALPGTVLSFTIKNTSRDDIDVDLGGWLENYVCLKQQDPFPGKRRNAVIEAKDRLTVHSTAEPPIAAKSRKRSDIVFADFEWDSYGDWKVEGKAFGDKPFDVDQIKPHNPVEKFQGHKFVNTHNTREFADLFESTGELSIAADKLTGKLTSKPFMIHRKFINFSISGGNHPGKTCINLIVDGNVVRTAAGHDSNRMRPESMSVADLEGKTARFEIIDDVQGSWGNIMLDHIVFSDVSNRQTALKNLPGYGSMAFSLVGRDAGDKVAIGLAGESFSAGKFFDGLESLDRSDRSAECDLDKRLIGGLGRKLRLKPGRQEKVDFLLTWWFPYYPNITGEFGAIQGIEFLNRHYENRFSSASAVACYMAANYDRLAGDTLKWNSVWYDSTLPHWFLDRTFVTIDCLATQTCHWFDSGRFYGWEGVTCCPGTCQHVWNYAQGLARIFPTLERTTREMVDYGIAFREDGALDYRAESGRHVAHDGQCGTILRAYREHLTAPDDAFLKRNWSKIRKSIEYIIAEDKDGDGLLEGKQYNTLDQAWYGPMAWISSMYLGVLTAGEQMAQELGDKAFQSKCASLLKKGRSNFVSELYNGEYFIHKPDPEYPDATNTNKGCHIDQLFGQSFLWQLGLERIAPAKESVSSLKALWKYNFTTDVGPYREGSTIKGGRWYAMPGEGGLLMCTWPTGGAEKATRKGWGVAVGYFNECMTGFEYQVASHMIYEGLIKEGLAIVRTIHDRYDASRRNPYNEIECSDHYSRAMASYGVFLAACGFEYHGPKAHIGFAPRLSPENFKAPFTAAQGWGSFSQQRTSRSQKETIEVKWGSLKINSMAFELAAGKKLASAKILWQGQNIAADVESKGARAEIRLKKPLVIEAQGSLTVDLDFA